MFYNKDQPLILKTWILATLAICKIVDVSAEEDCKREYWPIQTFRPKTGKKAGLADIRHALQFYKLHCWNLNISAIKMRYICNLLENISLVPVVSSIVIQGKMFPMEAPKIRQSFRSAFMEAKRRFHIWQNKRATSHQNKAFFNIQSQFFCIKHQLKLSENDFLFSIWG